MPPSIGKILVEWQDELYLIDIELYEEAVEYLRVSIPKQAALPDGDTTEYFGRIYYKSGKIVDGIHVPGTNDRLCFGSEEACSSVMKKIKRNNGRYKNKKSKTYPLKMNVHLHPGNDSNSILFSGPDTSLAVGNKIPVFIGNMDGDVAVFMPGMRLRGGKGPILDLDLGGRHHTDTVC